MSAQSIKALAEQTPVLSPSIAPRSLLPELSPEETFPLNAMPKILEEAILATKQITQAPVALIAQSFLAASSLVAQTHVNIIALDGTEKPCSLFIISVAESGERKSSCDGFAMEPIKQHQQTLYEASINQKQVAQNKLDAYEAKRKSILSKKESKNKERSPQTIEQELEQLGPPPALPFGCAITCEEPTFPALVRSLYQGYPSMGLFSNEGGEMLGGHAMNPDNKLRSIAGFSKLWDGSELKHKRVEGGEFRLLNKRLALHLMIQPYLFLGFMEDRLMSEQGFSARCLIAQPHSTMGTRFITELELPTASKALKQYNSRLLYLLGLSLPLLGDNKHSQELTPRGITLCPEAQGVLREFYNQLEGQLTQDGDLRHLSGFVNKLPEQALRIAVVLAFIENHEVKQLKVKQMQNGIEIAQYYLAERLRLSALEASNTQINNAETLRKWLKHKWTEPFISPAEVMQTAPKPFRKAQAAHLALDTLASYGWLTKLEEAKNIKGHVRQNSYALHEVLTTV